jgi:hypothetical protein
MACSYHHTGRFRPSVASIKVLDGPKNNFGFLLSLATQEEDGRFACDNCEGEADGQLCVKYCSPLMREELKEILSKGKSVK